MVWKNQDPRTELMRMHEEMNKLFDDFFQHGWQGDNEKYFLPDLRRESIPALSSKLLRAPLTDVYETDKEVIATIEMPGIDKKDVQLNVVDDGIEVKAERKHEQEKKEKGFFSMERSYAGMYRKIALPKNVDPSKAIAEMKDGILEVKVPKLKIEEQKRKLIPIK